MLRTSLYFVGIAVLALLLSDISITTFDPWQELGKMATGMLTPDFTSTSGLFLALLNTLSFALLGITIAVICGSVMALYFGHVTIRLFCAFIRSVHELFWAFLLMPLTGLNATCGILAIAIPYAGVFAKIFAEIAQESDRNPAEGLSATVSPISRFLYTTLPIIYQDLKNYTSYRFECALRSSAILGFIGLPTLGYHLETAFREGMYSEAAALLYCFYLLILSLHIWARPQLILIPLLAAVFWISWDTSLSLANASRFLSYDIIPWPIRQAGFYDGSQTLQFSLVPVLHWLYDIIVSQALPGIWNTVLLTQIALVCSALFALVSFPPATSNLCGRAGRGTSHLLLVVLRTTPEYILAYVFLQLWGPSMLPAIGALFLHNGAILAYLTARNANLLVLPFDASRKRLNRFFFELLPRIYGQFLAFLFYRWEVIMRESAILGILGIPTLGYFIDSAISLDHLDTALLLIIISGLLNMAVDSCSQIIRRRLRISVNLVAS
jgi:phosphonate transport system permease protein